MVNKARKKPRKSVTKARRSFVLRGLFALAVIIVVAVAAVIVYARVVSPIPLPLSIINMGSPWESTTPVYTGAGTLVAFVGDDSARPDGSSVKYEAPFHSDILNEDRTLLVWLPPGYNETAEPYPVVYTLHGYASRAQTWANELIDPLEKAIAAGVIGPVVVVMPDFSVSGNGTDDPATWFDDRSGNFYINSNLGRFEDHFFEEIVGLVSSSFNVRTDPEGVVLMGSSMGGYGTLYYGVTHPSFSHVLVPIYPAADLRYGIRGNKLADYDPAGYALIDTDNPKRIVNAAAGGGLLGVTEQWLYYPVFDSDKNPGPVWSEDRPVWERLSAVNPVEILDRDNPDLSGQRYYIIVGSADDFNLDAHIPVIVPRLAAHGAVVFPETNVIPGGRHEPEFIAAHIDEIIGWIGRELGTH
ncbi:MAG: alpha/beta fold hydrolase [Deltaproteobacteria bacterium]|nr:alpha/beta fold hydrolase [Candidatus Zymogenaceae bacterium]